MINLKDPFIFFSLLVFFNAIAYGLNIFISMFYNKIINFKTYISKQEILSSLLTLFMTIVVAIPGFILW